MDACKKFFDYKCCTMCGFPSITLEGTEQDWLNLRENAEKLILNRCKKDFAQWWCESLLPLLDKILEERKKVQSGQECDSMFWNSMIKKGGVFGSGGYTYFSGWFNILMPFLKEKQKNNYC